ncbi:MAG: polysaccharide deacetylase family protein, partial [Ktedonobacterales bacterium]
SLTLDPNGNRLLLAWSLSSPANRIQFAVSDTGSNWLAPLSVPIGEWTGAAPSLLGVGSGGLPKYFLSWTGTDSGHSLNVQYTQQFPQWITPNSKSVLSDTALGAPALGHVGGSSNMILAWTGTDPAHHLNAAMIGVGLPTACVPAPGVQPVSPVVISTGNTSLKRVSLTFDSDNGSPGNGTTYLNILQRHQIHATFFLTGMFAQANPAVARRVVTDGHDLGNHTQDHPDLINPARTDAFVCTELNQAEQAIVAATGHTSRPYFRPPYGSYNDQTRYDAAGLGYRTIVWSIDPRDWDAATTTQDIINRVLNSPNLKPGAVILMHLNSQNEPYALDAVIVGLQQRGYSIVPLSQLLQ